ncbi:hypothetical protein CKA32_005419 [Geitlerinema sp. FC II]|nr:hypothetical protein [Geitlerinema sp. CS-897]PPT10993.1 hypothetical protein CKA32_005419 [Geitlerinema sp. FC II]
MNARELARERMTRDRHQEENRHDAMLERAEEEFDNPNKTDPDARKQLTEERHHDQHLHDSMRERAEEEMQG